MKETTLAARTGHDRKGVTNMQQKQQEKELQQQKKRNHQSYLQRVHKCRKHTHAYIHTHTCRRLVINTSDNIDPYCKEFKSHDRLPGRRSHLSRSSYEPSDIARHTHTYSHTDTMPALAHCQNAAGDAIKVSTTKRQSGSVDIAVASASVSVSASAASASALLEIVVA